MEQAIWSDDARRSWPRNPTGYIFLAQSLDMIGRLLFGDDWTISDMNVRLRTGTIGRSFQPIPPLSIAAPNFETRKPVPPVAEQKRLFDKAREDDKRHNERISPAFIRRGEVIRRITAAAESGALETFYHSGNLKIVPIPCHEWSAFNHAHDMIKRCVIGRKSWMQDEGLPRTFLIFVSDLSLRSVDWKKIEYRPEPAPLTALPPSVARSPSIDTHLRPWTEDEMAAAIIKWTQDSSSRDCDAAWRNSFKARITEHGWKNRSFRDFWSTALGSKGKPGPRPYSAQ